jgi:hypothetical protein
MTLFGYDLGIRNNIAAVALYIWAKNEARNRVAAYRKTLTTPQSPQDKAAQDGFLSLLEPAVALMLGERAGTPEYANYSRMADGLVTRINEYSREAAARQ